MPEWFAVVDVVARCEAISRLIGAWEIVEPAALSFLSEPVNPQ